MAAEHMVLLLSDLQPGLRTDTFNVDVLVARLRGLTASVLRLREIHSRDREMPKLWVAAGGDFVEGEPYTHRLNLAEMDVDPQERRVIDILAQKRLLQDELVGMLSTFASEFSEVEFVGVGGNHGVGRERGASSRGNDDLEVYLNVMDRMGGRVRFQVETDKFYRVFDVQGHKFLLVHGHQIQFWSRTPLYGIINHTVLWHQVLPDPFQYVLMGHFHSINLVDAVGTPVYINGCFCEDSEYGAARGLKATAQQWVLGVHQRYGVTWERRVWLGVPR